MCLSNILCCPYITVRSVIRGNGAENDFCLEFVATCFVRWYSSHRSWVRSQTCQHIFFDLCLSNHLTVYLFIPGLCHILFSLLMQENFTCLSLSLHKSTSTRSLYNNIIYMYILYVYVGTACSDHHSGTCSHVVYSI